MKVENDSYPIWAVVVSVDDCPRPCPALCSNKKGKLMGMEEAFNYGYMQGLGHKKAYHIPDGPCADYLAEVVAKQKCFALAPQGDEFKMCIEPLTKGEFAQAFCMMKEIIENKTFCGKYPNNKRSSLLMGFQITGQILDAFCYYAAGFAIGVKDAEHTAELQ